MTAITMVTTRPASKSKTMAFIGILSIYFGLVINPVFAEANQTKGPEQIKAELKALEDEITKFRSMLENTQGQKSNLEGTLETNEKDISKILNQIKTIQKDLKQGKDKVSSLSAKQQNLQKQKQGQQHLIAKQIRASFELGSQQYLQVVLNQDDPNKLSRMMTYYDYLNRARVSQIEQYETTVADLAGISIEIDKNNQRLKQQRTQLQAKQSGLLNVRSRKQTILATLNAEIVKTDDAIQKRVADREHLETLLERISVSIVNLTVPADLQPFAKMKGELLLPVGGKISHRFGSGRSDGKLRWNGIFIDAKEGVAVHSIHYGRVVFSDWLRGFGLLLIINHGEGYMSLYGHNEALYREIGDWVSAGEVVASVGNSGGQRDSGLYFEIRNAGKPTNPQKWCRLRPTQTAQNTLLNATKSDETKAA